jgi:hypothetical protein
MFHIANEEGRQKNYGIPAPNYTASLGTVLHHSELQNRTGVIVTTKILNTISARPFLSNLSAQ